MANTKQTEPRYMEVDVPEQVIAEVAEIIADNEMEATIRGIGDKPESIAMGFEYGPDDRDDMMKILELVEDHNSEEEEESEED